MLLGLMFPWLSFGQMGVPLSELQLFDSQPVMTSFLLEQCLKPVDQPVRGVPSR
jgi:hypothetical protein